MSDLPEGPRAVRVGDTLFRLDQITWIKCQELTRWQFYARLALVACGILFWGTVCQAKGTWIHAEGLLGLLPLAVATQIRGSHQVATSGDTEDSYEGRRYGRSQDLSRLAGAARRQHPQMLELRSPSKDYYYLVRADRVAWATPWWEVNPQPLWVVAIFGLYYWLLWRGVRLPDDIPLLSDLGLFLFPSGGPQGVLLVAMLTVIVGLLSFVATFRQGLEMAGTGGIIDRFLLYAADRRRLLEAVAGRLPGEPAEEPATTPARRLEEAPAEEPAAVERPAEA